jgi:hypothetical protein
MIASSYNHPGKILSREVLEGRLIIAIPFTTQREGADDE